MTGLTIACSTLHKEEPRFPIHKGGTDLNLRELSKLLDSKIHCCEESLENKISYVCAGDLMSDILMFSEPNALLVTGLVNIQVIRTAEMLDIAAVIFIRGKTPTGEMLDLARRKRIPLLTTDHTLYLSCGLLYEAGLKNVPMKTAKNELKY